MTAAVALTLLVLLAGTSDRTGPVGAVVLLGVSVWWLRVNTAMEGLIIITFEPGRGFTAADLAGLAGGLIALWRLVMWARSRRRTTPRSG